MPIQCQIAHLFRAKEGHFGSPDLMLLERGWFGGEGRWIIQFMDEILISVSGVTAAYWSTSSARGNTSQKWLLTTKVTQNQVAVSFRPWVAAFNSPGDIVLFYGFLLDAQCRSFTVLFQFHGDGVQWWVGVCFAGKQRKSAGTDPI